VPTDAATRPLECAQLVWQLAGELAAPDETHELSAVTLDLLRNADHNPAELAHALTLGRTQVRRHGGDANARHGVRLLERAILFLGVRPSADDVGAGRRRP
jgi:hypothetical protein